MRYLIGFGAILVALGVFRLVGCGEETPLKCVWDGDCDDRNDCTEDSCVDRFSCCLDGLPYGRCENRPRGGACNFDGLDSPILPDNGICSAGVCRENPCDDGNECTDDLNFEAGCEHIGCTGCQPCDRDGDPGICDDAVCGEYPCNDGVLCSDGDPCTHDACNPDTGACYSFPRCEDHNVCTQDICDPETLECIYAMADGRCCLDWSVTSECLRWGRCHTGECR